MAKVTRDRMLHGWKLSASVSDTNREFGSGYPSDPKCKAWMGQLQDPLFGYCDLVRFSWAPVKDKLASTDRQEFGDDAAIPVVFAADIEDDDNDDDQFLLGAKQCMSSFLNSGKKGTKRKRTTFFEARKLRTVEKLF